MSTEDLLSAAYMDYVHAIGTSREWEMMERYEALVNEEEEEEPEDTNDATHWDEWMIDNAIDRNREDRADEQP